MARHNPAELATGAVVLVIALGFLGYAISSAGGVGATGGSYDVHADFDDVSGLSVGSDVRVAGVKVGSILSTEINPKTYLADVTFSVRDGVALPTDTSATVTSASLLGGSYIALAPGGSSRNIPPGGTITVTQGAVSLEQLLGKFIFSATNMVNAVSGKGGAPGNTGGGSGGSGTGGSAGAKAPLGGL